MMALASLSFSYSMMAFSESTEDSVYEEADEIIQDYITEENANESKSNLIHNNQDTVQDPSISILSVEILGDTETETEAETEVIYITMEIGENEYETETEESYEGLFLSESEAYYMEPESEIRESDNSEFVFETEMDIILNMEAMSSDFEETELMTECLMTSENNDYILLSTLPNTGAAGTKPYRCSGLYLITLAIGAGFIHQKKIRNLSNQ